MELEPQVLTGPGNATFHKLNIELCDLGRFLLEDVCNLFFNDGQITLIDFTQQTQGEHVLTMLRIVYNLEGFLFNWNPDETVVF